MVWDTKTIGIVIGIFLLGYVIGLVEAAIKQRNKDKKIGTKAIQEESNLIKEIQPSLLRITRSPSESLILEMGGEIYNKPGELPVEKRSSLINLLIRLRPWVENVKNEPQLNPSQEAHKPDDPKLTPIKSNQKQDSVAKASDEPRAGMVSEIDDILQKKIISSTLSNKGIHLLETETGGVMVYVGLNKYEGVEAVPNQEIKNLIQSAVREWEMKN
ncbi:MAG TPA: hypothetical protein VJZ78_05080 [Anaerolineales bacterium]|nr:hypothetical protein [Anaerolineales bacterium]